MLGQVNLVGVKEDYLEVVYDFLGVNNHPWHIVKTYDELISSLRLYSNSPQLAIERGRKARKWILQNWHNGKLIRKLIDIWLG